MKLLEASLCHPALGERPRLAHVGIGVHGEVRKQSYRLNIWAIHAYPYEAEMEVQGRRVELKPGMVSITPPGVEVVYYYSGAVQHRYAHFELREGAKGRVASSMLIADPLLYAKVWGGLGEMAKRARTRPLRAEVLLWELLWSVAETGGQTEDPAPLHPALAAAVSVIQEEQSSAITVPELAHRVGVSPNHLIRLFRREFGVPVAAYVRRERVAQAEHLLRHTNLPPKQIAASVGIPNLQLFNKTMRRVTGAGPKALRERRA